MREGESDIYIYMYNMTASYQRMSGVKLGATTAGENSKEAVSVQSIPEVWRLLLKARLACRSEKIRLNFER